MAKVVQISNDDAATWNNLPGTQASFSVSGEEIDDTTLGQTFQSNLTGLVDWKVESDGMFKGFAGYLAEIKKQGVSTRAAAEPCRLESGKIYSITDKTKDIWDRASTVTITDNGTNANSEIEWIDYLFGRFKFKSTYTITGPVLASISYFPTAAIGRGNSYTLTMSATTIDESDFPTVQGNNGTKVFKPGLRTVNLELQGIFDATESAKVDLTDRNELIIEIDPAGNGSSIARGFFRSVSTQQSGAVGALEDETVNFSLSVPFGALINTVFNWRHTSTTLAPAIQSAITSFMTELNTYDVRYMPQGAIGQTPLDAIKGKMMLTDISLSGGLNNMNMFNINMQGTGAFEVV